jgi:Carboxypeptidase regulatory-like domain
MPCALRAQQSGSINGAVTDGSGSAIPNAQVVLTNAAQGTTYNTTSNGAGDYTFPALEAGTYNLQVTASGFEQYKASGIVLRVSRNERIDAKLTIGAVTTQVQVVGNARNYFDTTRPVYKKHDYGFTVGGPLFIPKIYKPAEAKTFFFYSEEWRHENVPATVFNQSVPSNAERTGDFSDQCPAPGSGVDTADFPNCPVNPATGGYFTNNQVPIDSNGKAMLVLIPAANVGSGTSSFYQASPSQLTTNREELFRIDHVFNEKFRGYYRFIYDSWKQTTSEPTFQTNSFPTVTGYALRVSRGGIQRLQPHAMERSESKLLLQFATGLLGVALSYGNQRPQCTHSAAGWKVCVLANCRRATVRRADFVRG